MAAMGLKNMARTHHSSMMCGFEVFDLSNFERNTQKAMRARYTTETAVK